MKATTEQLRGNLSGFKKAVRRRDVLIDRLREMLKRIGTVGHSITREEADEIQQLTDSF